VLEQVQAPPLDHKYSQALAQHSAEGLNHPLGEQILATLFCSNSHPLRAMELVLGYRISPLA